MTNPQKVFKEELKEQLAQKHEKKLVTINQPKQNADKMLEAVRPVEVLSIQGPGKDKKLDIKDKPIKKSNLVFTKDIGLLKKTDEMHSKYYTNKNKCKVCGTIIQRNFKGHISTHLAKRNLLKNEFIFERGPELKIYHFKCKTCQKQFPLGYDKKRLLDHASKCKVIKQDKMDKHSNEKEERNNDLSCFGDNDLILYKQMKEKLSKMEKRCEEMEKKIIVCQSEENLLKRLQESHETLRTQVDGVQKRVEVIEPRIESVEKKTDDQGKILEGLLRHLIEAKEQKSPIETQIKISNQFEDNQTKREQIEERAQKEKQNERDRDRERERERNKDRDRDRERVEYQRRERDRYFDGGNRHREREREQESNRERPDRRRSPTDRSREKDRSSRRNSKERERERWNEKYEGKGDYRRNK